MNVKRRHLLGLAPLTAYLLTFTFVPVVSTLWLSMHTPEGVWSLAAFRTVTAHYQFGEAVANTLVITGLSLTLEVVLGLATAVLLAGRFRAQGVVRVLLLVPLGVPTIVSASAMRSIFGSVGYLNEILARLGVITIPIDWLGNRGLAVLTVAVADAWKVTPLVMLILLAGLQAIPRDLYEAARNEMVTAQSALASAQARLEQAQAALAVAEVVLLQTRNSHQGALSRVEQNKAVLARTQNSLSKTTIRSPLTGVITQLNVEVGERAVHGSLRSQVAPSSAASESEASAPPAKRA